jgi:RNA polymerase sigma-70 factor (ECF subfamily)
MGHDENGSDAAWRQALFERFEEPLVRYATRLIGDADRGRDIVQDVFLRLCGQPRHEAPEHAAAWLYTVCRNRALDVRKKEQRMTSLPQAAAAATPDSSADPARAAQAREEVGRLRAILDQLPDNQREVICLKIDHGFSYRQISDVTGLSVSNVGYLLHHGLRAIRRKANGRESEQYR